MCQAAPLLEGTRGRVVQRYTWLKKVVSHEGDLNGGAMAVAPGPCIWDVGKPGLHRAVPPLPPLPLDTPLASNPGPLACVYSDLMTGPCMHIEKFAVGMCVSVDIYIQCWNDTVQAMRWRGASIVYRAVF